MLLNLEALKFRLCAIQRTWWIFDPCDENAVVVFFFLAPISSFAREIEFRHESCRIDHNCEQALAHHRDFDIVFIVRRIFAHAGQEQHCYDSSWFVSERIVPHAHYVEMYELATISCFRFKHAGDTFYRSLEWSSIYVLITFSFSSSVANGRPISCDGIFSAALRR